MKYDVKEITPKDFPNKLLKIPNSPKKLYAIGNLNLLYKESFGIVGTRRITEYGKKTCEQFSKEFICRNIPIVSGMAIGTDEIAHRTTLKYKGETIAVLGCGFEFIYPEDNKGLFEEIIANRGLVLSEYSINTKKSRDKFPERNRIIAALSEGILVIEAAEKSGSAITARWAKKYDKRVFAIPGRIDDKMSLGTNKLINEFAILTMNFKNILDYYPQFGSKKWKNIDENKENTNYRNTNIKQEWKEIYYCLEKGEKSLEEVQLETNRNIRELLKLLTEMELFGLIIKNSKSEYEIKK